MTTTVNVNLVEKDYYPKGLVYQSRIDAINNTKEINAIFTTTQNDSAVVIFLPDIQVDSGTMIFFRPSQNALDKNYKLIVNINRVMIIPKSDLIHGKYILKVNWHNQNKEYYSEQNIFIK